MVSKSTKEDLEKLQLKYERWAEKESEEGNETERHLSGQLILLTTVLITANILVLADGSVVKVNLSSHSQLNLIFAALICEILATLFGVLNYLSIERKYDRNAGIWAMCVEVIQERKYTSKSELKEKLDKEKKRIKSRTQYPLHLQIIFIFLSLSIYAVLLHKALYR